MKKLILFLHFNILIISVFAQSSWNFIDKSIYLSDQMPSKLECDIYNNIWVNDDRVQGGGLLKYNGCSWELFTDSTSGLSKNDVKNVRADDLGNIWISYNGGLVPNTVGLTKYDGQDWTHYDVANDGIFSNRVYDIEIDEDQNVWTAHEFGISKFNQDSFIIFPFPDIHVWDIAIKSSDSIWFLYSCQTTLPAWGICLFNPTTNQLDTFNSGNSNMQQGNMYSIAIDNNGRLWITFVFGFYGVVSTLDGSVFFTWVPGASGSNGVHGVYADSNNDIWAMTCGEGLYKYDGTLWTHITQVPINGNANSIVEDKLGYMWYGELYSGIYTNRPSNLTTSTIFENACNSYVSPSGNSVWTSSGTYMDTIPNSLGGDSIMTIYLTVNPIDISITQIVDTLFSNATGVVYQWIDCNNGNSPIPGATDQSFTPTSSGSYAVIVADNGCSDTSTCYSVNPMKIVEINNNPNFKVHPNPATNKILVDINIENQSTGQLTIYNIQAVEQFSIEINKPQTEIDISNLADGIYFIRLTSEAYAETKKIVKTGSTYAE
ncbi:MAG: T9SS type A sorting domain-containing protein [Bacteroidales bacterium]|nr:T9SS type A sorting domain-containing protein [Bacteroidales bacterium]MCF8458380.1 T9SS type A sorting domain-containing protein [Bacteroidales bacterium]